MVSIVIPCYNVAEYVAEAIQSVVSQTYPFAKIICVDDGSQDNTLEILQDWAKSHPGLIQIIAGPHKNAAAARNRGFAEVATPWVQFLDADDLLLPNKLSTQLALVTDTEADLVVGTSTHRTVAGQDTLVYPLQGDPWVALGRSQLGNTIANLFRSSFLRQIGGWNESLRSSQEYDLMFRLLQAQAKLVYDRTPSSIVRERPSGSISQTHRASNWERFIAIRAQIYQYLLDQDMLTPDRKQGILQSLFNGIRSLYAHDHTLGWQAYQQHIPRDFVPDPGWYSTCYQMLGFRTSEQLFQLIKKPT